MAYFSIIPNQGNCRTAEHEFKLIFLNRTTVVPIPDDAILKTCFSLCPFDELLKMTENYVYLVGRLIIRCALFGEYVDEVHHFLGFGYMEQPVVVIQLVKVKFFRGQVGLQNVMHATCLFFNFDLAEVVDFKNSMVDQGINRTQPLFIVNESKGVSLKDDFIRLTRRCTIEELHDNKEKRSFVVFGIMRSIVDEGSWWYSTCVCGKYKIKIAVEDDNGYGVFVLFDREAVYLLKKSCADLFVGADKYFGTFCVRRVCDAAAIIAMFELPNYDADDECTPVKDVEVPGLDDISSEVDIMKEKEKNIDESIPVDRECSLEIEKILFAVLDGSPIHVIKKETVENPPRGAKVKRNLKKVFGDVADEEFGPTSNVLKNRDS
ncbi:hypothetical protein DS421_7g221350 [Arachis hypogaea]|nr:hypothetical protein DS421_7g221350 [Arachis hypogaea]